MHKTKAQEKKKEVVVKKEHSSEKKTIPSVLYGETPILNVTINTPQPTDIYESLKEKFTDKEILLIRRAFTYMTLACPASNKQLLEQLKLHAINQLKLS